MCVVWGVPYLLIKIAVREIGPAELVWPPEAGTSLTIDVTVAGDAQHETDETFTLDQSEIDALVKRNLPFGKGA